MDFESDGTPLSIGLASPGWPADAYPNGIATYVSSIAEGMRALGHRTTILAGRVAPGDWGDAIYSIDRVASSRGVSRRVLDRLSYRIATRWTTDQIWRRALLATARRAVAEQRLQLLEMEESFGSVGLLQQTMAIPVCVRLHGPWFLNGAAEGVAEDAVFRRRVAREGQALRRARAITSPSRDVLERTRAFYGLPLEMAEVIPNPTPPMPGSQRWRPDGCNPKQVLFVGRFDRHKGGDLMIEAFGRVLRAVPDARLCFAGPSPGLVDDHGRRWDIEGFVDDRLPGARASGRVRLLGKVPNSDLAGLRRAALVSVVCSRYENFPYTVIEAMAMGCPLVASRVGGIPEIIRDGVDGLLHRAGDPEDLAAKIVALLAEPVRAAALGAGAVARCEQEFHPVALASRTVDYYRRILRTSTTTRIE